MTGEEQQLLLLDLCARLPYGFTLYRESDDCIITIKPNDISTFAHFIEYSENEDFKPYLRPMSSMTEKEREHLQTLHNIISDENYGDGFSPAAWEAILDFNNYCREHHLDNGGLITLGLAIEAPEGMYDTKQ